MIILFAKTGCPYCAKAIAALDALGLSFTKMNIADENVAEELIAKGGKRQVPYIIDGDTALYESDAIVSYLNETYGKDSAVPSAFSHIRVHTAATSDSMCHPETLIK